MNPAGITGLAGNILNSQYNSALGNTLQQNLAGSQTENVFGSSVWTFINLVRIFQQAKLDADDEEEPIVGPENPVGEPSSYKALRWEATKKSAFYQRLAYLFKFHLPLLGEMKVPSPVDFGISDDEGWKGFTRLHVGDVANLHYKGSVYDTFRACNHVKYNYGQGFDGTFNPLFFGDDDDSLSTAGPLNRRQDENDVVETKDFFQSQLESFANTQWRIGVVVSWAFSEYSNLVSTDQAVADNKAWQATNMAFELAQFLVLHQLGGFQEDWINSIMNKEMELGAEAKLDETQIFASIANIKSMEEELTERLNSTIQDLEAKNMLANGALSDLIEKTDSLKEEIQSSTKESNDRLVADYEARLEALQITIDANKDRGLEDQQAEYLVATMKAELDKIKLWFAEIEKAQAMGGAKDGKPSTQNQVPQLNGESVQTVAGESISLNPGADSVLETAGLQEPLQEGCTTLAEDFNLAKAKATFVVFEQQANQLLSRLTSVAETNGGPEKTGVVTSTKTKKSSWGIRRFLGLKKGPKSGR
jgi:hypothetical protein